MPAKFVILQESGVTGRSISERKVAHSAGHAAGRNLNPDWCGERAFCIDTELRTAEFNEWRPPRCKRETAKVVSVQIIPLFKEEIQCLIGICSKVVQFPLNLLAPLPTWMVREREVRIGLFWLWAWSFVDYDSTLNWASGCGNGCASNFSHELVKRQVLKEKEVTRPGFEPELTVPKTVVLPLHYRVILDER